MSAVVQFPHSNTNATVFYRVVDSETWCAYINGLRQDLPVISEHTTYGLAESAADKVNYPNGKPATGDAVSA